MVMTGKGHYITGVVVGSASIYTGVGLFEVALITALVGFGALLPDKIEKPLGIKILKHRGISHWFLLWAVMCGAFAGDYFWIHSMEPLLALSGLALATGGLVHLMGDLPNPMGIPLVVLGQRYSLNWWRSGENEFLIILFLVLAHFVIGVGLGYWKV